jgi:hypothetical protein
MTAYEQDLRKGIRAVRRVYRRADTAGEKLERVLLRLYRRKTVPRKKDELSTTNALYRSYLTAVTDLGTSLGDYYKLIGL